MTKQHQYFVLFIAGALVLPHLPFIHWPFSWLSTYFHEISHGIGALISGGEISRIVLRFDGSGLCYTRGGWRPLVVFAGYAGTSLWGALIYVGARMTGRASHLLSLVMSMLIALSAVLWAEDMNTWLVLAAICVMLYLSFHYIIGNVFPQFMEFAGTYVMVSAIWDPTYQINIDKSTDSNTLQQLTSIPELAWVAIWCLLAVAVLAIIWRGHGRS